MQLRSTTTLALVPLLTSCSPATTTMARSTLAARTATTGRLRRPPVTPASWTSVQGTSVRPITAIAGPGSPSAASMASSRVRLGLALAVGPGRNREWSIVFERLGLHKYNIYGRMRV